MALNTDYVIRTGIFEPALKNTQQVNNEDIQKNTQQVNNEDIQKIAMERYSKVKV